jgi:hypothetical protein
VGFSVAKRQSDEISAGAQSRTELREGMTDEPRGRAHKRSRNLTENKASWKNMMRVPTMNPEARPTESGARHGGSRQHLGSKLESDLESVVNEPRLHPSSANNELEPVAASAKGVVLQRFKPDPLPALRRQGRGGRPGRQWLARLEGYQNTVCPKSRLSQGRLVAATAYCPRQPPVARCLSSRALNDELSSASFCA